MQISITMGEKQKLEANFEGHTVFCDQPISNDGEASAPSPFDYFLASTALCAGYYVKAYCKTRNIPTEGIQIVQNNTKDPQNKYKQTLLIQVLVPEHISTKDREGIARSIDGCAVKKAIQQIPDFQIEVLGRDI